MTPETAVQTTSELVSGQALSAAIVSISAGPHFACASETYLYYLHAMARYPYRKDRAAIWDIVSYPPQQAKCTGISVPLPC
jgi:hypothetical protein